MKNAVICSCQIIILRTCKEKLWRMHWTLCFFYCCCFFPLTQSLHYLPQLVKLNPQWKHSILQCVMDFQQWTIRCFAINTAWMNHHFYRSVSSHFALMRPKINCSSFGVLATKLTLVHCSLQASVIPIILYYVQLYQPQISKTHSHYSKS